MIRLQLAPRWDATVRFGAFNERIEALGALDVSSAARNKGFPHVREGSG